LVTKKWQELGLRNITGPTDYSIERCILQDLILPIDTIPIPNNNIKIALPTNTLTDFYTEHGLLPLSQTKTSFKETVNNLDSALNCLALVKPVSLFLNSIIQTIQVIKADDEETDISYSHPEIPFSIFASICSDNTLRSNLRVAESILHEALHLKLTLIEDQIPLIKPFDGNLYFSPWRDEKRPARGVLHGLFVFKGILDYFKIIINRAEVQLECNYIESRINQITTDIFSLQAFISCSDLTKDGATLTANLLPLN